MPSLGCDGKTPVLLGVRYLPGAEAWTDVKTAFYTPEGELFTYVSGERDDLEYRCIPRNAGCFIVEFQFEDKDHSAGLEFAVSKPTASVHTAFQGDQEVEYYYFCVDDGELVRSPTNAPTLTAMPTATPTLRPSTSKPSPWASP